MNSNHSQSTCPSTKSPDKWPMWDAGKGVGFFRGVRWCGRVKNIYINLFFFFLVKSAPLVDLCILLFSINKMYSYYANGVMAYVKKTLLYKKEKGRIDPFLKSHAIPVQVRSCRDLSCVCRRSGTNEHKASLEGQPCNPQSWLPPSAKDPGKKKKTHNESLNSSLMKCWRNERLNTDIDYTHFTRAAPCALYIQ